MDETLRQVNLKATTDVYTQCVTQVKRHAHSGVVWQIMDASEVGITGRLGLPNREIESNLFKPAFPKQESWKSLKRFGVPDGI
jgi:hypothetical protein